MPPKGCLNITDCYAMYDVLTNAELALLQDLLFSATEKSYRLASLLQEHLTQPGHFQSVHAETAWLFLEVGQELASRLANTSTPAAVIAP
jgi:hypothetical protein